MDLTMVGPGHASAILWPRRGMRCDRCLSPIINDDGAAAPVLFYHCLECNNSDYDICSRCARVGVYCQNDNHAWLLQGISGDGEVSNQSQVIPAEMARCLAGSHNPSESKDYPSMFHPPSSADTPNYLFTDEHRFIRNNDPREILIYTEGWCLRNGQNDFQGGCRFVYRPSAYSQAGALTHGGTICIPLEIMGPTGDRYKHTVPRAELRAVIAALQFRDWNTDCNRSWRSIVIATSSEYVAVNAARLPLWVRDGWQLNSHEPVKHLDLWKLLLRTIRQYQTDGVNVSFWRIPRELNNRADEYANAAPLLSPSGRFYMVKPDGPTKIQFVELPFEP